MEILRPASLRDFFALAIIAGCAGSAGARRFSDFREVGRFHSSNIHSNYPAVAHFVVAPEGAISHRSVVIAYARRACVDEFECFVLFWTNQAQAARTFPITHRQAATMVANYRRNRGIGNDGLQCYDFGSAQERCATIGRDSSAAESK